jgi:phosphatidate cytidylyltransferase
VLTRFLTALVGLSILVPAIVFGGSTAVELIVPFAMVLALDEYAKMAFPDDRWPGFGWTATLAFVGYLTLLYLGDAYVGVVVVCSVLASMAWVTFRPGPTLEGAAERLGRHLVGAGWIGGAFAFMAMLRRLDHGLGWIFVLLGIAWLSDTGGYFAGKYFGNRKLYERVSPKKTVEGFVGGVALATIGVVVIARIGVPSLTWWGAVIIGLLMSTASVVGDLGESLLKRAYNVKDSGSLIPGHGGMLDRVDSVIFVAPFLYAYARLIVGD